LPAFRNYIPFIVHVIQPALGAFIRCLGEKGCTMTCKAHERDQEFGENESKDIGKSQRLQKEGNARINKVSAVRKCVAKKIAKVQISRYFK
jgi:hypothetical protein